MAQNRSIFEDVTTTQKPNRPPRGGLIDKGQQGARGAIRIWLFVLFAMVMAMIAVGGLTRLTDSGLSITEWKPVTGAMPPTSEAAWAEEFEKYKQIPEYTLQNEGMSLSEFKHIYWWEWGHRQLGRTIGLVWALGFLGFAVARKVPSGWYPRLLLIGALGGLQGAIGWWMVASGLEGERLDVASYRLATHLGLAFVILGFIAWFVFQLGRSEAQMLQARRAGDAKLFGMSTGLLHFAFLQILLGALVAGIDAGRGYTDWPLMGGQILPPDPFELTPVWRNFFENAATVQFIHRMAGYLLFAFGIVVWLRGRKSASRATVRAFNAMAAMLVAQVVLGIVTVIYGAPLALGLAHQVGAVALFVLILRARFMSRYPAAYSLREGL
ncbi:heme A synthase [Celeribacter marinus]|uniref:Heme A synthase n=1 Tax=Celeribacter marinus TaxID=1397108 RepID=A0A0N9ZDX8_9RHOB|nr:heme A synthase [Celeribacter marinus]ALI54508.1 heme A synthase, cytochrome oxidase biogenesis protein Cox15-CtaA [Celeribacter marinus]SFK78819.1 cytochrome c oxidase assembly protein subunit 15 [Celeribacter marinus]